jgi:hypothetical protein
MMGVILAHVENGNNLQTSFGNRIFMQPMRRFSMGV